MLMEDKLIDEMVITYIPVTLGSGVRLFQDCSKEIPWTLKEAKSYPNDVLQVTYTIKR